MAASSKARPCLYHSAPERSRASCLVGQDPKCGDRDGHLDDDRADRQEPNFALCLGVHGLPNAEVQGSIRAYRKSFCLRTAAQYVTMGYEQTGCPHSVPHLAHSLSPRAANSVLTEKNSVMISIA